MCAQRHSRWRQVRRATWWNAATGMAQLGCKCGRPRPPTLTRSPTSPARSAPSAPASRRPPRPISPGSRSCATNCARARTPLGREQVDIQWQVASAWMLNAEGKHAEALKAMSSAADAEDKTEKSPVTPGPLAPARELYGQMLLELGMTMEALSAFEATKAKEPNRYNGYLGAAQAAEKLGDNAPATASYGKLVALADPSSDRPELAAARKFVETN